MIPLLLVLLFGPAQTIAGKYVPQPQEAPLPAPLPGDVDALCRLIESGHGQAPELYVALGDALLARGDKGLAYRAFHRAHKLRPKDNEWGRRMQERKYKCDRVPTAVIQAEEIEAAFWVDQLKRYQRDRVAHGKDPADLDAFYERYGRPEDDLHAYGRARRFSFIGGVVGVLLGVGFGAASRHLRRRAAWLPLVVAAICFSGPALTGQTGLFLWGGGFALAGGTLLLATGKR